MPASLRVEMRGATKGGGIGEDGEDGREGGKKEGGGEEEESMII